MQKNVIGTRDTTKANEFASRPTIALRFTEAKPASDDYHGSGSGLHFAESLVFIIISYPLGTGAGTGAGGGLVLYYCSSSSMIHDNHNPPN